MLVKTFHWNPGLSPIQRIIKKKYLETGFAPTLATAGLVMLICFVMFDVWCPLTTRVSRLEQERVPLLCSATV